MPIKNGVLPNRFKYYFRENEVPTALAERYAGFVNSVLGSHMKQPEVKFIDGSEAEHHDDARQ